MKPRCPEEIIQEMIAVSFARCLSGTIPGHRVHYRTSVSVSGCLMFLTCACGRGCTLLFKSRATAARWGLLCLTEPRDAVPGAIREGSLLGYSQSFMNNTCED